MVLVAIGALAGFLWFDQQSRDPGPLENETTLVIPRGTGVGAIADLLAEAGVINDSLLMVLRVRWRGEGRELKAGEYVFVPGQSLDDVIDYLSDGRTVVRRISVPEGLTTMAVLDLVRAADGLTGEIEAEPAEGYLLPETYHYELGDTRTAVIQRMASAMTGTLEELWPNRDPGIPLDSPEEAVILASIVEKETGVPEERAHIAGVFFNRLARGMPLQSDPTVIFALTEGKDELGRALTRADWEYEHPYNTYRNAGLPPGPIANPGFDAIYAVLHPQETDDLYFVADGTGGHAFARTLDEHNDNVAAYREWLRNQEE
ncbi:MAG: endolytic transglycosylase MltG [Pseudomonadota bacterium]